MNNFKGQFSGAVYNAYGMATFANAGNYNRVVTGVMDSLAAEIPAECLGDHFNNGHLYVAENLALHLLSVIDIARQEGEKTPARMQCQCLAAASFFDAAALAVSPARHPVDYAEITAMAKAAREYQPSF